MDDCAELHPLPLYESAPSADAWEAYCRARFSGDRGACAAIPAMLVPDLRSSCSAASDASSSR